MSRLSNSQIILSDLSIGYKTKGSVRIVASGVNGTIHSGELTCLMGENGIGKSTLLRTLSGFQPPLSGSIKLKSQSSNLNSQSSNLNSQSSNLNSQSSNLKSLEDYSPKELAQTIGVVLTEKPDVGLMTARELVAMGRSPYTGFWGRLSASDDEAVNDAIAQVGIPHLADRQVGTLSDGERQKVMIAKALAQQTDIIFLDEPTAFLDYPSKVDMLLLLRRISHEASKTIFLSTHDLELTLQAADTIWLMTRSEGLLMGTPRELASQGALGRFIEKGKGVTFDPQRLSVTINA